MSSPKKARTEEKEEEVPKVVVDLTPKRTASILIPSGSVADYPDFLKEIMTKGDDIFEGELEHTTRIAFEYIPEKDMRDVDYPDGSSAIKKVHKDPLPSVDIYHLVPKKWADEEEKKAALPHSGRGAYVEFLHGMFEASKHYAGGAYTMHNVTGGTHWFSSRTVIQGKTST